MNKVTPLISVEAIEPCLPFWTEALGFEITATVPHGDAIGFAMLNKGGVELMYQTRASIEADLGESGAPPDLGAELEGGTSTLFIEVDALDRRRGGRPPSPDLLRHGRDLRARAVQDARGVRGARRGQLLEADH